MDISTEISFGKEMPGKGYTVELMSKDQLDNPSVGQSLADLMRQIPLNEQDNFPPEDIKHLFEPMEQHVLLLKKDGAIVGFTCYTHPAKTGERQLSYYKKAFPDEDPDQLTDLLENKMPQQTVIFHDTFRVSLTKLFIALLDDGL